MTLNDYEIICPLSNNNSFKVRHVTTNEYFLMQTIDCNKIKENEFTERINERISLIHPNCLKFVTYFKESGIIYLIMEYCPYGNLFDVIDLCLQENKQLREESICKIIYQVALALKVLKHSGKLRIKHIFLDYDFNVKLYNFDYKNKPPKRLATVELATILYNLTTLTKHDNNVKIIEKSPHYSVDLMNYLNYLLTTNEDLNTIIDEILCNETVLFMVSKWKKDECFVVKTDEDIAKKIKNLRLREQVLRVKEEALKEREHKLEIREKKITITEKLVKEKLMQAELYLKRSREKRSHKENLETTIYAECGSPSVVAKTSKKIAPFLRSRSERRIKYKGHSPLKEINCGVKGNKRASLFGKDCRPISWLDEDMKKQAFDLLKVMNGQKEDVEVKHTYL